MESRLVTLLRKVLIEKNFDLKLDKRLYSEFTVLKVKKKTVIIKENDKLDYLYLLVRGSANVVHFTPVGELIVFNHITNTSIFGLLEFMDNKHDFYKSVAFFKDTRLIRIPVERFEKEAESIELLKIYNQFLLDFAKHSIATFDLTKNYGRKKNLIEFFLSKCVDVEFPVKISLTKKVISDYLRINESTMYRYLNELIDRNCISRKTGKIIISKENYDNLLEYSKEKGVDNE